MRLQNNSENKHMYSLHDGGSGLFASKTPSLNFEFEHFKFSSQRVLEPGLNAIQLYDALVPAT